MPDVREEIVPITFENGLIDALEPSVTKGSLFRCRNWIPESTGNLRARLAWQKTNRSGLAAGALAGRGIGAFTYTGTTVLTPSIIQFEDVTGTATSLTITSPDWTASTAGNCIVVLLVLNGTTTGIVVPSGFTLAHTSPDGRARIYVAANAASLTSITFSWTDNQSAYMRAAEVINVEKVDPIDKIVNNSGNSTTFSSGTTAVTTTDRDIAFVIALFQSGFGGTTGFTNGYSNIFGALLTSGTDHETYTGVKILTAAEATSTTRGFTFAVPWQGVLVTLKAAISTVAPGSTLLHVAHAGASGYDMDWVNAESLSSAVWSAADAVTVSSTGDPVAYTAGLSKLFYTNVRFATARQWDPNVGGASLAGSPPGRCIEFHKERIFIGGTLVDPTRLHWSDVGSSSFSGGDAGNIEIGRSDGEPLEDVITVDDVLLIGKRNSLWMLIGAGSDDFARIKLNGGGAAPGRSMCATPYGAFVAGRRHVWRISGGTVEPVSQAIAGSYGMTGNWMEIRFIDDSLYVLDQGSGTVWVLDVPAGRWHDEVVDDADERPGVLFARNDTLMYAPVGGLDTGLLAWRLIPGGARAKDYDPMTQTFEAFFQLWPVPPEHRFTPLHLYGKWRQRGGATNQTGITITPYYDGVAGTAQVLAPRSGAGVFRERVPIADASKGQGISFLELRLSQTVPSGQASLIEPEDLSLGLIVERLG